jgi:hypothetical protein
MENPARERGVFGRSCDADAPKRVKEIVEISIRVIRQISDLGQKLKSNFN